ncbi:MAG: lysylphosphatidylglycerol synthase transmembrane domain-containing protein [Christensenellales bacterium]
MGSKSKRFWAVARKNLWYAIVIALCFSALSALFFSSGGVSNLAELLKSLGIGWLLGALFCVVCYWFLECFVTHIYTLVVYKRIKLRFSLYVGMMGLFYSALTPFSMGGQPMQVMAMRKSGMDTGPATSIIALKTIIYSIVLTLYSLLVILFKMPFFISNVSNFSFLAIIGFLINGVFVFLLLLFSLNRSVAFRLIKACINLLAKVRIVKNPEERIRSTENQVQLFRDSIKLTNKMPMAQLLATGLTFLQFTAYFLIPYCLYRSFGFKGASVVNMVSAQSFVTMVSNFVPLPGGSGGAEGSFLLFFRIFFPEGSLVSVMFLWRLISYYLTMIVGGLVALFGARWVRKHYGYHQTSVTNGEPLMRDVVPGAPFPQAGSLSSVQTEDTSVSPDATEDPPPPRHIDDP